MSWIREGQYTVILLRPVFYVTFILIIWVVCGYPSGLGNYSFKFFFQTIINLYSCFITFISLTLYQFLLIVQV